MVKQLKTSTSCTIHLQCLKQFNQFLRQLNLAEPFQLVYTFGFLSFSFIPLGYCIPEGYSLSLRYPFVNIKLRVIFNIFYALLGSVYQRVIFNLSYYSLDSICLRVIFNLFFALLRRLSCQMIFISVKLLTVT